MLDIRPSAHPVIISPPPGRELTLVEKDKLFSLLAASRSENTNLAYRRAWRAFVDWTRKEGFSPFPAEASVVALYLAALNDEGFKNSTLTLALSAITAAHRDGGEPRDFFKHHLVSSALKGARRSMVHDGRSRVSKPRAFSQVEIARMIECLPRTVQGLRDKAILLLGVNAGLRASEFAALQLADIEFDDHGMDVLVRSSKTDQEGAGEKVYVSALAPAQQAFDAVRAMRNWLEVRKRFPAGDGAVFMALRKGGKTPHLDASGSVHGINRDAITAVLVRAFEAADLEGRTPSSHSLRHSFITQAFSKHLDANRVAKVSRHRNLRSLMEYDQTSRKSDPVSLALWS